MAATVNNYKQRYSTPDLSPLGTTEERKELIKNIYLNWRTEDGPQTKEQLLVTVQNDFEECIGAIGVFTDPTPENPSGTLRFIHGILKHKGAAGSNSPHRNVTFAYLDDVVGTDIQSIAFDQDILDITDEVNVAGDAARHFELFNNNPKESLVGWFKPHGANMKTIKTRHSMFFPYEIVAALFGRRLSARQAFLIVRALIIQLGMEEECALLLDFLLVAATKPNDTTDQPLTALSQYFIQGYNIDAEVSNYRRNKVLCVQLPDLEPSNNTAPAAVPNTTNEDLVDAVNDLRDETRKNRQAKEKARAESKKPKPLKEKLGERNVERLKIMCDVADEKDLPPLYHAMAKRVEGESMVQLLQDAIDDAAEEVGANRVAQATPQQAICLKAFAHHNKIESETGNNLLSMSITPDGATSPEAQRVQEENSERVGHYNLAGEAAHGSMSMADAKAIRNTKGFVPRKWKEASVQVESYTSLLASKVGPTHPATEATRRWLNDPSTIH